MQAKIYHPAEVFRSWRAKYLAIARKHGFRKTFYVLDKEYGEGKIDPNSYKGLIGELVFAMEKREELDLTPTLDTGDHCDFVGSMNKEMARFDVTTNLNVKELETYEPFQKAGKKYYIALVDHEKRKVEKIIDINFPFCATCGGRLLNIALIGQMGETEGGSPTQSQRIIQVCSSDHSHKAVRGDYNYYLPSITDTWEYYRELYEQEDANADTIEAEYKKAVQTHGIDNALLFSKEIGEKICAVGENQFFHTTKDDGDYATSLYWRSDLVDKLLPQRFEELLDDFDLDS